MIHEAAESGAVRRRPQRTQRTIRSQPPPRRLTIVSAHFALLALLAHILIVAHTVSHDPPDAALQHCSICTIGDGSTGIPTAVLASCERTAVWLDEPADRPTAPQPEVEETTLARGPPFAALAAIG